MGRVRDVYLNRAVGRLQRRAANPRIEQLAFAATSDLRFRLSASERQAALTALTACAAPHDYFVFARDHLPTEPFYQSGTAQREYEILDMLAFVSEHQPETVVEIGTQYGGTTFLLAALLPSARHVVGVDILVRNQSRLRAFAPSGLKLNLVSGSSSAPGTFEALTTLLRGRPIDLLFIDGDHTFRGVYGDFATYAPLVRRGGFIAFHDIVPDLWLRAGTDSPGWAGDVPAFWRLVGRRYTTHEFVDSWDQEGYGIGLIEYDPDVALPFSSADA